MKTKITELLGIKYPIIQGGMAWQIWQLLFPMPAELVLLLQVAAL